ncbi:MAG: LuxR C-terminal-related transcriptional regulator, partial [Gaiellaceae bacterium]
LTDASDLFATARCPYERARVRLSLATALSALGLEERSRGEAQAALEAFASLGARSGESASRLLLGDAGASPLTRRERQVLALVAAGQSNRGIAEQLVVSEHTVHRHVANILRKLAVPTRAAAAARATRDGLL